MTTFEVDTGMLEPVPLVLDRRVTLGAGNLDAPVEQTDRASLGRPVCLPLDPSSLDKEAAAFLDQRAGSSFYLLALTCGFRAEPEAPMEKAWVEVQLHAVPDTGTEGPTAWSMEPTSLDSAKTVSTSVTLNASLKLASPLVPVEVGPELGTSRSTVAESRMPYLEAFREGTARPSWIFTATQAVEIRGTHRLRAVIEVPQGVSGQAQIAVGATLKLKRFGVISYRAALDDVPAQRGISFGQPGQ